MVDRFFLWLGAGVVTAGVSVAMIAGAGLAVADDGSTSVTGGATSSESSNATGSNEDSGKDTPGDNQTSANGPKSNKDDDADDEAEAESPSTDTEGETTDWGHSPRKLGTHPLAGEEPTGEEVAEDDPAEDKSDVPAGLTVDNTTSKSDAVRNDESLTATVTAEPTDTLDKPIAATPIADEEKVVEEKAVETSSEPADDTVERASVVIQSAAADTTETAVGIEMAFAAPASFNAIAPTAAAPQGPTLLNVIGTLIFNLYAIATRLLGGPPVVPPGSTVTVRQSTLQIDCGDGYVVPADWYFPTAGSEPPTRLIYLQHGFLASGPWYSYTAATLAEQTNSIVVAPSLTSNFFACDACWLGGAPMQQAVANLFLDENTALADSAPAAGYTGELPQRVVLVGHSLGGGLVAATAGYMVDNDTIGKLAGVVMLDGVGMNDAVPTALGKVPDELPIYQLAAPSYFWNQFGAASEALVEARPDRFVGVVLAGGSHVDAMQGGNFLIQFSQQLVAGFSTPQNVEAAKILMVGWINDMFAGTQDDGIYGQPGEVITIDTPAGEATAVALPSSLTKQSLWNLLQPFVSAGMVFFTFEPTCAAPTAAAAPPACSTSPVSAA
jgi:Alpha/beta hydrolase family